MGFQQFPIAGTALVRDAINSPNFVHLQSGWSINRDGSAEFNNVVVRGSVVATDFRSANYVPGTSGFDINGNTGIVEFNSQVTVNGPFAVNGATTINGDTDVFGALNMHTAAGGTVGSLTSGAIHLFPDAQNVATTQVGLIGGLSLPALAGAPDSLLVLGPKQGANTQMGLLVLPACGFTGGKATTYVTAVAGQQSVLADSAAIGGGQTFLQFPAMRPTAGEGGNIAPTTTSTTFVNLGNTAMDVTIPYPPSGQVTVTVGAALSMSAAIPFGILGFEIRNGTAAGAVLVAASDNACMFVNGPTPSVTYSSERTFVATGIAAPASGNLFIRPMFRVSAAATLTAQRPYLIAQPDL